MNKTNEKKCGNCSRRKFYQVGYRDGFDDGYNYGCEVENDIMTENYLRLKKMENKVENFISFYDGILKTYTLNGHQLLDNLKECLKRNE